MRISVHDGWTVRAVGGEVPAHIAGVLIPATVPGCVHLDLLAAGLIPDPYLDVNEPLQAWIGRVDWTYETAFTWSAADGSGDVDLVAQGLDTHATVVLNGTVIGRVANMHRTHRFAVAALLRDGINTLEVAFDAPLTAAERDSELLGPRPQVNAHPFNAVRKMASNFGWDWGPDLPTVGIWKPLHLETWSRARIASVRPLVNVRGDAGVLDAHVNIARDGVADGAVTVSVSVAGQTAECVLAGDSCEAVVTIDRSRCRAMVAARIRPAAAVRGRCHRHRRSGGVGPVAGRGRVPDRRAGHGTGRVRHTVHDPRSTTCRSSPAASTGSRTTRSRRGSAATATWSASRRPSMRTST